MNLGPRLDLRQSQSLVMTPQLQQAIRLLALSNLEVESFIAEEIERNPLLESGGVEDEPAREPETPSRRWPKASDRKRSTTWSSQATQIGMRRWTSISTARIFTRTARPTG
jgi:DNA-directed RNA polymerase specialized sigma54-like protein